MQGKQCDCGAFVSPVAGFCARCGLRARWRWVTRHLYTGIMLVVATVSAFMLGRISVRPHANGPDSLAAPPMPGYLTDEQMDAMAQAGTQQLPSDFVLDPVPPAPPGFVVTAGFAATKKNWQTVSEMVIRGTATPDTVQQLLGAPDGISGSTWYYKPFYSRGFVSFVDVGGGVWRVAQLTAPRDLK